MPRFFSVAEVAERFGVDRASVLRLIYSGALKAVDTSTRPGKRCHWRISPAALQAFERARSNRPAKPAPRKRHADAPETVTDFY